MSITPEILEAAKDFARQPGTTYPGLKNFLERALEKEFRTAAAACSGVAFDAVPRKSFFDDDECMTAADVIWEALQEPSPMSFFEGKPYHEGLAAYKKHLAEQGNYKPKSKGAYL